MLVAKYQTRESMQDGSTRTVLPNAPFLNPATKDLPRIELWARHIIEGTEEYKESMALVSEEDKIKYIDGYESSTPAPANDEEIIEDVSTDSEGDTSNKDNADENTSEGEGNEGDSLNDENPDDNSNDDSNVNDDAVTSQYTEEELEAMDIDVLKDILKDNNISFGHNSKKETLIKKIIEEVK